MKSAWFIPTQDQHPRAKWGQRGPSGEELYEVVCGHETGSALHDSVLVVVPVGWMWDWEFLASARIVVETENSGRSWRPDGDFSGGGGLSFLFLTTV